MDDFERIDRIWELENRVEELKKEIEKKNRCYARRILDLDERTVFVGKMMVVSIVLSVLAVTISAMF